jgi:cytochrome c oxidase subunit 2
LSALLQVSVPGVVEHRIADMFSPLASPGENEKNIAILTIAITFGIFVVVAGLIVYTIWRFRRRGNETEQEPPQVYGSNQLEVAWTVVPILIVFVLIGVSARVIAGIQNASPPKSTAQVRLIGHQWWWEVEYPQFKVRTANEIHVPLASGGNNATYLRLESIDVIHSFWVPQLAGKTDLIPNRVNYTWIDPKQPGVFLGNCAEYCGNQHANMLLRVVVQPVPEFNAWAAHEAQPADSNPQDPKVQAAKQTFESLACVNCHNITGTVANGRFGPDLTHLMTRQTLGSGVLVNDAKSLRDWVNDPQEAKPGCLMPSMKLNDSQLDQVVTYLQSLR